jgi:HK97 family phage prohead protease
MIQLRALLSSAEQNDLPDSAFAYIGPGGKKDADGKTTPRSLRHYPVHDKAHADNALARANAAINGDNADAKAIATKALPKIKTAVAKFAEAEQKAAAAWDAQHRDGVSYNDMRELLFSAISAKFRPDDLGDDDYWYCYVVDFDDDTVVFSAKDEKSRCSYAIDGNDVTLGDDPEPVRAKTTWVPVELKAKTSNHAAAKRAFSSLLEQPPAHVAEVQVRLADDGNDANVARFVGYASTTGVAYSVRDWLGEYTETILPGAFAKTLREQTDVPLLFNHDGIPLASTGSGTSRLSEDKTGLRNEADLDRRDAQTNSICVQLARGVLGKMSFSFRAVKETWNDEYDNRGVNEAALYDSSIVTYPVNPSTSGALVDEMRSALGREGRSLWLADGELSVRTALPMLTSRAALPDADDLLERALRALVHADEVMTRAHGPHGRARTFQVAQTVLELRAGKVLSAANQKLLQTALDALTAADKNHAKVAAAHSTARDAVSGALGSAQTNDGESTATPPGNLLPQDGAGPRSLPPQVLAARRQADKYKLNRR